MARKAYSDEERAQVKEALMAAMIQCIVDRGLIHSSIDTLCGKVGISKTFSIVFSHPRRNWCTMPFGISSPDCWITPVS